MRTRFYIATQNGYIFTEGKLTAYEFKSALIDFENEKVEYTCVLGGKETTFETELCPKVYSSKEHYQQGISKDGREVSYAECIRSSFFYVPNSVNEQVSVNCVAIENNEIVYTTLPRADFLFSANERTKYIGEGKFFKEREQALLHLDIVKVDANGEETTYMSPAKRVALDEEQMQALKAVQDAIAKASELGVKFALDINCDKIYAYSGKDVKETIYDCMGDYINDYGYCINDLMTDAGFYIPATPMDDTGLYVEFK